MATLLRPASVRAVKRLLATTEPRRSQGNVNGVLGLSLDEDTADTDDGVAFTEHVLGSVDLHQKPLHCQRCRAIFLRSEYNRDGNAYRCPNCNHFNDPQGGSGIGTDDENRPVPRAEFRQMEAVANDIFAEYARLYYGRSVASSVFVWDAKGEDDESARRKLGVAVLFSNRIEDQEGANEAGGVWHSTHVVSVEEHDTDDGKVEAKYSMHSTVYLDVAIKKKQAEDEESNSSGRSSRVRFNGFLSRDHRVFSVADLEHAPGVPHVSRIGTEIQAVENGLRDILAAIYFGKAAQVLSMIRQGIASVNRTKDDDDSSPVSAAPRPVFPGPGAMLMDEVKSKITHADPVPEATEEPATNGEEQEAEAAQEVASSANGVGELDPLPSLDVDEPTPSTKKEKKKSKKPRWEVLEDEDGNRYYYNRKTEETAWERPDDFDGVEPEAQEHEDAANGNGVEAAPVEDEAPADTSEVGSILSSLGLSQPIDSYVQPLLDCDYGAIETREQLIEFTQWDTPEGASESLLESIFSTYGDRRKLLKWVKKQPEYSEE